MSAGVVTTGVMLFPHTSVTAGGVGCTCASDKQLTVLASSAGTTGFVAGNTVIVCVTKMKLPQRSVTR